jgi:hypothetical protein
VLSRSQSVPGRLATALAAAAVMAGAAVFGYISYRLRSYTLDDAFISFRYARNLATGHGIVFNPGERVEGYTNFLWVVILALPFLLGIDPALFVHVVDALLCAAAAALVYLIAQRHVLREAPALAALPAALLLVSPAIAISAAEGLETLLFITLLLLACYLFLGETRVRAIPWSALASVGVALARPDGVLFAPWFFAMAVALRRPRSYLGRFAAWFGLPFVAYYLARTLYYGSLLANTFYAKRGGTPDLLRRGWENWLTFAPQYGAWLWLLALVPCLRRETRAAGVTLAGVVLVRFAFAIWSGGAWIGHFRFLVPALPFLYLLVTAGAFHLVRRQPLRGAAIAVTSLGMIAPAWAAYAGRWDRVYRTYSASLARAHVAFGRWAHASTSPGALIAMDDVGAGPYYADRPTLDMLGLNDAHIAHLPGRFGVKHDTVYVLANRPHVIVLGSRVPDPRGPGDFPFVNDGALFVSSDFRARYRPMRRFEFSPKYILIVYQRLYPRAAALAAPPDPPKRRTL